MISFSNLRPAEIEGIQHGVFEFGLNVVESMPFVCFRVFEMISPQAAKVVQMPITASWPEIQKETFQIRG